MKDLLYNIVDIETTGSYADANSITEIAIITHDGHQIVNRFQTLVQPARPIPLHIQALTGISNEMVADAPSFEEIASQVFELLNGKIFVAHNVNFDYSFLYHQLKQCDYEWKANKLCTVRLARKIFAGLPSYSLGNLCKKLDIEIHDRHRAMGDATATTLLFERLIAADDQNYLTKSLHAHSKEQRLPSHISAETIQNLPYTPGVYLFKNNKGKIIYIGKAIHIYKRVLGHFTGNNISLRRQQFINEIHDIDYVETGTELMALLTECHLIKKHWPIYNRSLKRFEAKYGLFCYEDLRGYLRLSIGQLNKHSVPLYNFNTVFESTQHLLNLIDHFKIDHRLCTFYSKIKPSKIDQHNISDDTLPKVKQHNKLVNAALESMKQAERSFVILDRGRMNDEKSYIYIKNNNVHALGFIPNELSFQHIEEAVKKEDLVYSNFYMMNLAENFANQYPSKILFTANN